MFDVKDSVLLSIQESNPILPCIEAYHIPLSRHISQPPFGILLCTSCSLQTTDHSSSLERPTNSCTSNRLNGFPWSADLLPPEFNPCLCLFTPLAVAALLLRWSQLLLQMLYHEIAFPKNSPPKKCTLCPRHKTLINK